MTQQIIKDKSKTITYVLLGVSTFFSMIAGCNSCNSRSNLEEYVKSQSKKDSVYVSEITALKTQLNTQTTQITNYVLDQKSISRSEGESNANSKPVNISVKLDSDGNK